jgi:hypothetical protein
MFWRELDLYFTFVGFSVKEMFNQLHAPETASARKEPWVLLNWGGGLLGPRESSDALEETKICCRVVNRTTITLSWSP